MGTFRAKKQKTLVREMLPNLPLDVIDNIFTWVPTKPVVRFMSLNKHFLTLLTSQVFAEKHLSRSPRDQNKCSVILQAVDPNKLYYIPDGRFRKGIKLNTSYIGDNAYIVGCSNGIVCLSHQDEDLGITFWNPATKECRKLPHPLIKKRPLSFVSLGFGFHPTINDYKVVKLTVTDWMGPNRLEVEVYSLRTNSWREMGEFPYRLLVSDKLCRAVVNGIVHWFGRHKYDLLNYNLILAFDIANEVFRELPVPEVIYLGFCLDSYLRTYQGYLSIILVQPRYIDVWAMNDYGVDESWNKVFRMECVPFIQRPLDFIKDDEILIKRRFPWYDLLSYNSNTGETKNVGIPEVEYYKVVDAIPYLESLVQLKAHTEAVEDRQANDVEEYLQGDDA